jgi:hypothetical protein
MSNYRIEIDYTSNENKAAKIKILDESGKTLLKSDVVIPKWMHGSDSIFFPKLELKRFIPINYSQSNKQADEVMISIFKGILGEYYIAPKGVSLNRELTIVRENNFGSNNNRTVVGYDEALTLSNDAFNFIKNIVSNKNNNIEIESKRKWILFGQKYCGRINDNNFVKFKDIGNRIEKEEINIQENLKAAADLKALKQINSVLEKKPSSKPLPVQPVVNVNKAPKPAQRQSSTPISNSNRTSYHNNNNDLDAFDLMYMSAFPDIAPFYKPTSGIAWMMYFNNQHNHDNLTTNPIKTINQIQGFEGINGCTLRLRGEQSYKVDLYRDEAKTQYLGTVDCHPEKGLMIKDSDGNTSIVKEMEDKPGYSVLIEGSNSSKALVEVVQDRNNDLIGNWTIEPSNAMMVSSSMRINDDLSLSSDTNKVINLDNISSNSGIQMDKYFLPENQKSLSSSTDFGSDNQFSSDTKKGYDFDSNQVYTPSFSDSKFTNDLNPTDESKSNFTTNFDSKPSFEPDTSFKNDTRYEPPPPPPPPPEDSFNFTSSDPYSSNGFSM